MITATTDFPFEFPWNTIKKVAVQNKASKAYRRKHNSTTTSYLQAVTHFCNFSLFNTQPSVTHQLSFSELTPTTNKIKLNCSVAITRRQNGILDHFYLTLICMNAKKHRPVQPKIRARRGGLGQLFVLAFSKLEPCKVVPFAPNHPSYRFLQGNTLKVGQSFASCYQK